MENLPIGNATVDDYRQHVERARSFSGTDIEYCERNNLDTHKFSYHKSVIKKKKKVTSGFARIQPAVAKETKPKIVDLKNSLPDPVWLARFLQELAKN